MSDQNKLVILGITGNIGCGKTTVASIFAKKGARIIDADKIAHRLLRPKGIAWKRIVKNFGKSVLNKNKSINHKELARIGFANVNNWRLLCRIVHPQVIGKIKEEISRHRKNNIKLVVVDAALLIESRLDNLVDYVVVVKTDTGQQLKRTRTRSGLTDEEFKARLKFQLPVAEKIKKSDFIVDNRKSIKFTERQVGQLWKKIMARQSR